MTFKKKATTVVTDETKIPEAGVAPVAAPATSPILTQEEHAILQRVMSESDEWRTLTEGDVDEYSLQQSIFQLPLEAVAKERSEEMKFRWITRSPQRVDQIKSKPVPLKWYICNRTQTPFLSKYVDPVTGSINREDQMLVFKPWWMWAKELAIKRELADAKDSAGDIRSRDGISRDGVHMTSGIRSLESGSRLGAEITGDDIIMGDEGVIDRSRGVTHGEGIEDLIDA